LVEIDPLVDRVQLVLPCAEGHGRNTVADHPARVEPAIQPCGRATIMSSSTRAPGELS
jgi:hypothetical protein